MITKEQYKYVFKDYLRKYPIGKVGQLSLAEEYSKISIIAYIISREQGLLWEDLVLIMSELRGFKGNRIPKVTVAQITKNLTKSDNIVIPKQCPICGGVTQIKESDRAKVPIYVIIGE
jgi:hypothetical protein